MADMTDSAFCCVVKSMASPFVFREMISSEAVVRENKKTIRMATIHSDERPLIQQLFGSNPDVMAEAARIIETKDHPDGFDINMGCPVYKIVHGFNGAALMREPERAATIVQKMKAAVSVPISVKIRLGWSDPTDCLSFSKILEQAGADLITVHGRTKMQGYTGKADWNMIQKVKQHVSIPVLANGDISSASLVQEALTITGCDGVLIGRGALGNPWIFKQIEDLLTGKPLTTLSMEERIRVIRLHLNLHCAQYGEHGIKTFRKHLTWYFKGLPGATYFRQKLHTVDSMENFEKILEEMKTSFTCSQEKKT